MSTCVEVNIVSVPADMVLIAFRNWVAGAKVSAASYIKGIHEPRFALFYYSQGDDLLVRVGISGQGEMVHIEIQTVNGEVLVDWEGTSADMDSRMAADLLHFMALAWPDDDDEVEAKDQEPMRLPRRLIED